MTETSGDRNGAGARPRFVDDVVVGTALLAIAAGGALFLVPAGASIAGPVGLGLFAAVQLVRGLVGLVRRGADR